MPQACARRQGGESECAAFSASPGSQDVQTPGCLPKDRHPLPEKQGSGLTYWNSQGWDQKQASQDNRQRIHVAISYPLSLNKCQGFHVEVELSPSPCLGHRRAAVRAWPSPITSAVGPGRRDLDPDTQGGRSAHPRKESWRPLSNWDPAWEQQ